MSLSNAVCVTKANFTNEQKPAREFFSISLSVSESLANLDRGD
jgi:hypothetical protein